MLQMLNDGLVLRSISEHHASDRDNLPDFYMRTFGEAGDDDPEGLEAWTRDLLSGQHPTTTDEDIWVVVDPAQGDRIVSALLLIPQTWHYAGVPFGVGRIELVATDKEYRRRGLIRALMDAAHQRSAHYGHLVQAITGIRHYYRRFGYSMALDLGVRAALAFSSVPNLPDDHPPRYGLRPATEADVEQMAAWDAAYSLRFNLSLPRSADLWRYELTGHSLNAPFYLNPHIITDLDGQGVGYVLLRTGISRPFFGVYGWVLGDQTSYLATFEDTLYGIKRYAERLYEEHPSVKSPNIWFSSDLDPALDLLIHKTFPGLVRPDHSLYAWYVRVADLSRLVRHIAPALEHRLHESGAHRYTGTLKITFFDLTGLTLTFTEGRITDVTHAPMHEDDADAGFPDHTFLDVIFGRRRQDDIQHVLPECFANRKAAMLLSVLFPRQRSCVMPLA